MSVTNIVIASDLHYLAPGLTDHGPCFQETIRHSDGKVMGQIEELTDAFLEEVIARAPDVLILAGDLAYNGERESHEVLADKLQAVRKAGIRVLVMPGNHDLDNSRAARFSGEEKIPVETVGQEAFAQIYGAYGLGDALARDSASLSYIFEAGPGLRILMLDVNTPQDPCRAGEETLAWTEAQLKKAARAGARVLAVSHQNILVHNSLYVSGYLITNSAALVSLYERYPVIANLTGHLHCQHISRSGAGLYEIATSALPVYPAQYGVITVSDRAFQYETRQTDVASWARKREDCDPTLLSFREHAKDFFLDVGRRQVLGMLGQTRYSPAIAGCIARLDAAYFAGRMDTVDIADPVLARVLDMDLPLSTYVRSILEDGPVDLTHLEIDL